MIDELAVPFVVIERDFVGFEILLRGFAVTPGFAALEFVELTFGLGIPGVEKLARVAPLGRAIGFGLLLYSLRKLVFVFLILLVRNFNLLLGLLFHGERLEERVDAA